MPSPSISPATLDFLEQLKENNTREWFEEHRALYDAALQNMVDLAEALRDELSKTDNIEQQTGKRILFRIYRDVRFSKDKAPYKTHLSGSFRRATKWLRGGYYFHIGPGESFVGGGFWAPNPEDLKRIRQEIAADDQPLRKIIADPTFQKYFGKLGGDAVKTAPKGFSKEHPAIDLIRHKQFVVSRSFTDSEVQTKNFVGQVVATFEAMRPFFDYMSDVLTTDANGEINT